MKKKITIILNKNYPHLGKRGNITKVSTGYAFNYLIPNHIAELASIKKIKHFTMLANMVQKQNEAEKLEAQKTRQILQTIKKISITKKTSDNHMFFGSITEKDIINLITQYTGKVFEKKQIHISSIKSIGIANITVNILNNIECSLNLNIIPENI
uniref:50S ribosomal protein L9, chloroplastic n=1 Tax=Bornetia secundiflora TaxID=2575637 RepID=A0A4D6WMA9_9FLOR|nr:ribosomal protein L9 [Bornetia secundiflora]